MKRLQPMRALAVAVAVAGSMLSASADTSAPQAACVPVLVPAVGPACPAGPGLWRVEVGPGISVTTHGGDPIDAIPGERSVRSFAAAKMPAELGGWPLKPPACVTEPDTQFHHRVIYARAADRPDLFAKTVRGVRIMVHAANGMLRETSARYGVSLSYRVLCVQGDVAVANVKLPVKDEDVSFGVIVSELIKQGYSSPFAKYWIFYDGPARDGASGVGTFRSDDTAGADNANNFGPGYAVTFNVGMFGAMRTMMHENGHNLGAVQTSAPNSNRVGHCIDGHDIMCYREQGGLGLAYRTDRCSYVAYDCRSDDYFNPRPKRGSYLATRWNTASPANRFLAGCVYRTGTLEAPGNAAAPAQGVSTADIAIPSSCRGRPFSLSAALQYPAGVVTAGLGAVPGRTAVPWMATDVVAETRQPRVPDADVCFYKGAALIRCHERRGPAELVTRKLSATASGAETGTIPANATRARIVLAAGAHAVYVFNAV